MTTLLDLVLAFLDGTCSAGVLADYLEEQGDLQRAEWVRKKVGAYLHILELFPELWDDVANRPAGFKGSGIARLLISSHRWAVPDIGMTTPLTPISINDFCRWEVQE